MKILYAASEALPFMASGGLADVAGSLPKALRNRRQACRVVMPLYSDIKPELRAKMKYVTNFNVFLSWRTLYCGVFEANHNGVIYYFRNCTFNAFISCISQSITHLLNHYYLVCHIYHLSLPIII